MCKRLTGIAVLVFAAAAIAVPQAALAVGGQQKPSPVKIIWGE